ncbi:MAG: GNAT family N-acetyltransferase [Actinomycetia bacterium]|nr:GNAT family N-acetyltransferase [Actinomycetes bacterium]
MERIESREELAHLASGDPWVRWVVPAELPPVWFDGRVAVIQRGGKRPGFWVTPLDRSEVSAEQLRPALTWLGSSGLLDQPDVFAVSAPQQHAGLLESLLGLGEGGDWEWMWTDSAPPVDPREAAIVELDDRRDGPTIEAFSRANNPRVWTEIGTGRMHGWLGLMDEAGHLIAVGGAEREATGVPHLAGIVTAVDRRREGLGSVVSAALTRRAVAEHGVCTLGMFSDNDTARRVYHRLGYRTARAWASRRLP